MLPIQTSYGLIRPWSSADAEAVVKYANNRKIWLNLRDGFPHPYTPDDAQAFLERASRQTAATLAAIATREEAIGGIGISVNEDVHRLTAEMGYWLGEAFWGRGITTAAVRAFAGYAFETYGVTRLFACVFAWNAASARVLEKAGFELEAVLRRSAVKEGKVIDQWQYAMIH